MEIATKFNIDDIVYFMLRDQIHKDKIKGYRLDVYKDTSVTTESKNYMNIQYLVGISGERLWGNNIFNSIDELIEKLKDNFIDKLK